MAKFSKKATPAFKKSVIMDQYKNLTATADKTLKQVQQDYIEGMWPEDRKLVFPKYKK